MNTLRNVFAGVFLLIVFSGSANAAALSFTLGDVVGNFSDSNNRVVGWSFTTNAAITVTDLGFYDAGADGLTQSHAVGLYTSTGMLLVSGTVPGGTLGTLDGLFRYVDVADTTLAASTTYVIGAVLLGSADLWTWLPVYGGVGASSFTADPAITLGPAGSARFECCTYTALEFPDQLIGVAEPGNPRNAFLGPNFQLALAPVPVPAAVWLFGSALGVLGGVRRKAMA